MRVKIFCSATGPPVGVPMAVNWYFLPDARAVDATAGFAAGVAAEVV